MGLQGTFKARPKDGGSAFIDAFSQLVEEPTSMSIHDINGAKA